MSVGPAYLAKPTGSEEGRPNGPRRGGGVEEGGAGLEPDGGGRYLLLHTESSLWDRQCLYSSQTSRGDALTLTVGFRLAAGGHGPKMWGSADLISLFVCSNTNPKYD